VLGRFLFRWRGVIGFVAFGAVFWLARPAFRSCLRGVAFLIPGLAVRFWASGYIGIEGRVREIGARQRLASGPYRLLRHPLYIGNLLLVAGMLVALRPALWLGAVVLGGFIAEYTLIVVAEERDLRQKWTSGQVVKWSVRSPESTGEKQGTVPGSRTGPCEGTVPVFRQRPESFVFSRALVEWRTWVVTGVAIGLAMLKSLV
jgi:hypothetical protein